MKKIILAMTVLFSASAFADRMVIQNPQDMKALTEMKSLTIKKNFSFNNNTYVVVEGMEAKSLKSLVKAERVFRDMEIYLPENKERPPRNTAGKGWHVSALEYAKLPTPTRGSSVIVAVLDTGVDYNHVNLKPRMWTNKKEIPGNQIDDDGNGYVDDVHGYDFADKDADPMDGGSHGTHCAGIVAATKDAKSEARGVAPHVKLMAVRLIGSQGKSFMTDAVEAIKYSVNNGAKILTNSWRLYSSWTRFWDPAASDMLKEAIAWAGEKDVIFVAAAGNERKNNDDRIDTVETEKIVPAGYTGLSHLLVVASSTTKEGVSGFTNYGVKTVALAAPGSNIYSTVPGNRWRNMSGTSMATPLVAGALARGLSAGMTGSEAMANMKATTNQSDLWDAKVETGHINLIEYLK